MGATIAGSIGVSTLTVAMILYFRTRSRYRKETSQPARDRAPQGVRGHQSPLGLTGAGMVEAGEQATLDGELHGYPVAVGHHFPVRELEGKT